MGIEATCGALFFAVIGITGLCLYWTHHLSPDDERSVDGWFFLSVAVPATIGLFLAPTIIGLILSVALWGLALFDALCIGVLVLFKYLSVYA